MLSVGLREQQPVALWCDELNKSNLMYFIQKQNLVHSVSGDDPETSDSVQVNRTLRMLRLHRVQKKHQHHLIAES